MSDDAVHHLLRHACADCHDAADELVAAAARITALEARNAELEASIEKTPVVSVTRISEPTDFKDTKKFVAEAPVWEICIECEGVRYDFPRVVGDWTMHVDDTAWFPKVLDALEAENQTLKNQLGNAVGAIIDSGTGYCEGPHDVAAAIYRLTAERDVLKAENARLRQAVTRSGDGVEVYLKAVGRSPIETQEPPSVDLDDDERWGDPPECDPPDGTSWDGPWRRAKRYWPADNTSDNNAGEPIWAREALEHDGHEDCCHHQRFVTRSVLRQTQEPQ